MLSRRHWFGRSLPWVMTVASFNSKIIVSPTQKNLEIANTQLYRLYVVPNRINGGQRPSDAWADA